MTTSTLVDLVAVQVGSGGTGPLTLGSAAPASRGTEALANGATYSYSIQSGQQYETGQCTYMLSTQTIVRTPQWSSNGNAAINVPSGAVVNFTALSSDFAAISTGVADSLGTATNVAPSQRAVGGGLDLKAPIASPTFSGAATSDRFFSPTAPTASTGFGTVDRTQVIASLGRGTSGAPYSDAYLKPDAYVERHAGGASGAYMSGESNPLLSPTAFISTIAEAASANALTGLHSRMISDTAAGTPGTATGGATQPVINGASNCLCAYTGYSRAGAPSGHANRSVWAANFIAAHTSGNVPPNCVGMEIDIIPAVTPASGADVGVNDNFTGLWVQAAGINGTSGAPMWCTAGIFISSAYTTTGFIYGIRMTAPCKAFSASILNSSLGAQAGGLSVSTTTADTTTYILNVQTLAAGITPTTAQQMFIDGDPNRPIVARIEGALRRIAAKTFANLLSTDVVLIGVAP